MQKINDKKTLLLGASQNPERYSFRAMTMLSSRGVPTIAIGRDMYHVGDVEVLDSWDEERITDIHTVTIYLSIPNQESYIDYILNLKPERVILNPGAENPGLELLLRENDIAYLYACTLVLLSTGQY